MKTRSCTCLLVMLLLSTAGVKMALAQKFEVGVYGGGSFFSKPSFTSPILVPVINPLGDAVTATEPHRFEYEIAPGGVFGVRARENLTDKFGLEQSWTFTGTNNLVFPGMSIGSRMQQLYFNGNINALSSENRVRPYLSAGVGWSFFHPTDEGKVASAAYFSNFFGRSPLDDDSIFHFNFGGGVKTKLLTRVGLDFSVRDFVHDSPTFGFPNPSNPDTDNNVQVQGGINMLFGGGAPIIVHTFTVAPTIEASNTSLCPGEPMTMRIMASDSIPANQITYRWTVGGQEVSTAPEYTFVAPKDAGPYDVAVRVFYDDSALDKAGRKAVKKNPSVPADRKITMNVGDYQVPTATASLDRSTIQRGERIHLTSSARGSTCSGNLAYRWTANDGRIAAGSDGMSADFDSSNLAFSDAIQGEQCKPVRVSLEVSDQKGGKASDAKDINVCYTAAVARVVPPPPPRAAAIQLSDINFAANSARVNNCGKRILANELYPQLTDARYSDYDVLLVGHRDAAELEKVGKQAQSTLDHERVLNAASFLSGGGETCKDIELSRVKVSWATTEQTSEFKSNFCGASTRERRKDAISTADAKAQNRRVEVWLVPRGASMPSGIGTTPEVPNIINRGCPR